MTDARITELRAEHCRGGAAVAVAEPRLSWEVGGGAADWRQSAAELCCDGRLVKLDGPDSVLVDWPFAPLAPGRRCEVQVRAADSEGVWTPWSRPLPVEAAFLGRGRWRAEPIALAAPDRPAQPVLLRRSFTVRGPLRRARLLWTALGVAEMEVNGSAADDTVLSPGWTDYRRRLVHETADVTDLLVPGENVVGARLAGGWYTEEYGFFGQVSRHYGEQPSLMAQLVLEYEDGTSEEVRTDGRWLARGDGPLVSSGIYAGEHHDARRELPGWSRPGATARGWSPAVPTGEEVPEPEPRSAPPVRRIETLPVREVATSPSGALLLDFGQNLVGRLRIRVRGPRGTTVTLRHAEVLEDGELALRPLRRAAATDVYVLSGEGEEEWEPRFTFHGFRYARVEGWPGEFDPADVSAVVVHTDMARTGWFDCSDPLLNRLHENVVWSMRGNFLAIPTDCPQRDERLGWTGDIQVFAPTACFLYDSSAFLASWLRELALAQERAGGVVPFVVPPVTSGLGDGAAAAWGDAATVVPWVLHERYGDTGVLRAQYPSMRDWANVLLAESGGTGLWEGTLQFGDWLDPSAPADRPGQARTDSDIVASAHLFRSLDIVARCAHLLDHTEDARRFADAAEHAREAFVRTYVSAAGRMVSDAQTAYAMALRFGLVTDGQLRRRLARRLAELVRRDGYRISTGFVGTPIVTDALTDHGYVETAGRLLTQTENPSWLYPVTMGATTVWERWDSLLEDGTLNPGEMTSFNHYALGAVADWMHRVVAGLAPDEPGYRRIRVAPRPLPGLEHASARHLTPYGPAGVRWRRRGEEVVVRASVPPNTEARVELPGREAFSVGSGEHEWVFHQPAPEPRSGPLQLDSSTAEVIDDPRAYATVIEAIAEHSPQMAREVGRNTVWGERRTLRQALMFLPPQVAVDVERALAALARG
ncbi:alpha-L-rhamnosidase [Nocardiopsis terrae]|uniref:alpha-L-rhamnosidase n=1 Tax=Nocardiopsis terrae TaxID=372655 RepID=A0ABR9HFF6_9ACTN|nr:alpha-L-rhamnosidase [Nocardiopsis terrae]MBE1457530.1 alpha-L-rhamnosidase [Nocardiopsis terrae]GHC85613.1 alpha-L-rhamnosidase [Nocardiopsis terrae]